MIPYPVTDADDPRIASFRNIRERDLASRDGLFIAEGKVVLSVLFAARRFEPVSVLILDRRLAGMAEVLETAPPDLPVYVAPAQVIDEIAGFHLHRGVLALARRRSPEPLGALVESMPARCMVPVLVNIANHDNVGSIFRNAAAFGAAAVLLDSSCCDPLYRKAIRVSVGAALKVPFSIAGDIDAIFSKLDRAGFRQIALSPGGSATLDRIEPQGRIALYLGTEGEGLPPALMQRMATVRIPMARDFDSLNVAAASAIVMHHFFAEG